MNGRRRVLALAAILAVVTAGATGAALVGLYHAALEAERVPFLRAGLVAAGIGLTLVVLGIALFVRISIPLVRQIEENERKYRTLFESARDGILLARGLVVEDCNPQVCRIWGCTRDDLIGHSVQEFWPPTQPDGRASLDAARELVQAALAGHPQAFHWQRRRKDGVLIDTEVSLQAVTIGHRPALLVTVRDVTERRRAEEALQSSERRYRIIAEQTGQMVYDWNVQTGAIHWAGAIEQITGFGSGEYQQVDIGGWAGMIHPDDRRQATELLDMAAKASGSYYVEYRLRRKDGSYVCVEDNGVFLKSADGQPDRMLGTMKDITERKRADEELRRQRAFLRQVIDAVPNHIFVKDVAGRFVLGNAALAACYGTTPEGLVGKTDADFNPHDEEVAWFTRHDREVIGARQPLHIPEEKVTSANGAVHWLTTTKVPLVDPDGTCTRLLGTSTDITERKRAEQGLREREAELRGLFRAAPIGIGMVVERVLKAVNERLCDMLGYSQGELLERSARILYPSDEDYEYVGRVKYAEMRARGVGTVETRWRRKDGAVRHILLSSAPMDPADWKAAVIFTALDITDRKQAEEERERLETQLRQAQKMEAVGQLAGGIAHDFNNILTSIGGNVELALGQLQARGADDNRPLEELREVERSLARAAGLTRQLLAFGRRQVARPQSLDLNQTVTAMEPMLRRLISESIALQVIRGADLQCVRADANQVEQVVMNLVVNARDAMAGGGTLTIETANVTLDADYVAQHGDVLPGPYVLLSVSDTGCGMDARTLERAFEPFFTTKPVGQGTGLGLATVYGIVKQSGGHVVAYSEPGHGSTFRVYLPAVEAPAAPQPAAAPQCEPAPTGVETVLVCEDDGVVRNLASRFLRSAGYTVLAAANGAEALRIAAANGRAVDLLVTDVVMPDMNGRQLADTLTATLPNLAVLFVSGYTGSVIACHGVLDPGVEFLEKPFTRRELLRRVRDVLDRARRDA